MNDFGDLRSALHSGTEHILSLPQPEHVWNYIQDHLEITPQAVKWEIWGEKDPNPLRASGPEGWVLSVGSLVLATGLTFDLVKCSHEWSIVPALEVLPLWVSWADDALKRGDITQENHDAPLVAIEAKKAWLHGEISDEDLKKARTAAYRAASDAADANSANSAYGAARCAAWAAANSANSANSANYAWAARATAYAAARSAADTVAAHAGYAAYDAAYNSSLGRYEDEFCQYVLDSIMTEHVSI